MKAYGSSSYGACLTCGVPRATQGAGEVVPWRRRRRLIARAALTFAGGMVAGGVIGVSWGLSITPAPDWFWQVSYNPASTAVLAIGTTVAIWWIDRTGNHRRDDAT